MSEEFSWSFEHPSDKLVYISSIEPSRGGIEGGTEIKLDISYEGNIDDIVLYCDFDRVNRTAVN
jgi:hypothetical protein